MIGMNYMIDLSIIIKEDIMNVIESGALILLDEAKGNHRKAFLDAIDARGHDRRTKQYRHYDAVIAYMMKEWQDELE
jgi:hypothetical protein